MTKSELIELLARRQPHLKADDVDLAVKSLLQMMGTALADGDRIEVRGFGSFSLHFRPPRTGRNPKTGDAVALPGKHVPHFKPGKELRERVTQVTPVPAGLNRLQSVKCANSGVRCADRLVSRLPLRGVSAPSIQSVLMIGHRSVRASLGLRSGGGCSA